MNQPAKRGDLRAEMPETAKWVDAKRAELGAAWVDGCIKQALAGVPGLFYAMERGKVLGTPFPATHTIAPEQAMAVLLGASFAGFMATPSRSSPEKAHGTH